MWSQVSGDFFYFECLIRLYANHFVSPMLVVALALLGNANAKFPSSDVTFLITSLYFES